MCTARLRSKVSSKCVLIIIFILGLGSLEETLAQTTYYSRVSGDWNTPGTWSTTSHIGASCACVPVTGNHTVQIAALQTVTYSSASPAAISITTLTVNGSLVFGNGGGATSLTVTGDLTVGLTGSLTSGANSANAHAITLSGNLVNNGTFNQTANSATNQAITFNGTVARAIRGSSGTTSFNNMNVNGTAALSFGDNTLTSRTLNIANDLTIAAGATLQSGNTGGNAHNINLSGNLINNGTINLTANAPTSQAITFNSAVAESIRGTATTAFTFYNVNVNGAGALSFGDNTATSRTITITNDLTIGASGTLQSGSTAGVAHTVVLSGNLVNNGLVDFTANAATNHAITFNSGAAKSIRGSGSMLTFNNINVNGAGALSFGDNNNARTLNVSNDLIIATGATLQSGSTGNIAHNFQVAGSLINNGTINMTANSPTAQTFTFYNTAPEAIRGTATTAYTFYNLAVNGTSTVNFGDNTATSRTLNITNDLTVGTSATLQSANTAAVAHTVVLSGNLINNGVVNLTANSATAHTITFNSAAAKSIRGTGITFAFNVVNVNGTGALTFGDNTATSRTINIIGNLTIGTGATFQSGNSDAVAQTIALSGNLVNNGTINFAANAATNHILTFNSTSARSIRGTATTTYGFYHVNVIGTGALSFGDNVNTRTLTISGNLAVAASSTFQSGTTAAIAHTINLAGNLTNGGVFNLTANTATNHTLVFNSSTDKTISGSGTNTFTNITLQTGSVAKVNVNTSILVNGVMNFAADGVFAVGSSANITLGQAATITGFTTARFIQLDGGTGANGNLIVTSNGTTASWQITYPIGTATGGYSRLFLTAVAGTAPTAGSTISVKAIYNNSIQGQLRRTFRIVVAGNVAATTFTSPQFYFNSATDVSGGDALANYTSIWHLNASSGTWASTTTGTVPGVTFFGPTTPTHNLITGTYYYTTGSSTAYPNTWYTYQSGVWSDWRNWTLDPSGTTLLNGLNLPPQPGDEIVILSGITITNDVSGQVASSTRVEENAVLDMQATINNTLGLVSGTGLLRLEGVNLPTGDYNTSFVATSGGTIEYYNTGGTLPSGQLIYNKLLLSNTTGSAITFISANNVTVNNNFNITQKSGVGSVAWQINNTTATARTNSIVGDLVVSANGKITVGTGVPASPHTLTLTGNFINNGVVQFFDATDAAFSNANYTAGNTWTTALKGNAVNVTFNGLADRTITCNNQTDFYRLIVNKGINQQPMLTLYSSNVANFRLFGPNNIDNNTLGLTNNALSNESLSLQNGTLQLTGFITIPNLIVATGAGLSGGWPVPQSAALWVNSANVSIQVTSTSDTGDNGRQIYVYGLVRLTNGTINMGYSRGLLGGVSGVFLIEGGTLNTRQFRTTYLGSNNRFSYNQTGGTVNIGTAGITGVDVDTYPRFALPYPECTFIMSGGTLNVAEPIGTGTSINGGILISAAASNISVTGGDVNVTLPASAVNFTITSTAAFYNLSINKAGAGTSVVTLNSMDFNDGSNFTRPVQPLVITNNLTLVTGNTPTLSCNNQNLTVSGNFVIQASTVFTPGANTVTFNGSAAQSWTHNGTITSLNNVVVNKSGGTLTLGGGQTFPDIAGTPIGLTLTNGTLNDGDKTITVTGALINNATHVSSSALGSIVLNGATSIGGANGIFGNLTINTNNTVSLSGDQAVTKTLRLLGASTTLNLGSYNLAALGNIYSDGTTGVAFTATKRILTSGFRNDGGLTRQSTSGSDLLFPLGTGTIYTPVTINVTASTPGKISVNPVTGQHPNVNPVSQSLQYYWNVTSTGFAGVSSVVHKAYTFSNTALLQGTLASYKPTYYNPSNFTWTNGTTYNATASTVIPNFSFGTTINGEFLAGNLTAGALTVYYSKVNNGSWSTPATWSTLANRSNTSGSVPCPTCPVVIGDGSSFNHTINVDGNNITSGSLQIAQGSTLNCSTFTGLNFGVNTGEAVTGVGTLKINVSSGQFPAGDFKDFIGTAGGTVEWYGTTTTLYAIPAIGSTPQNLNLSTYYNLIVNPFAGQTISLPATNLTVYNNLTKNGAGTAGTSTTAIYTLAINGDFLINQGTFVPQNAFGTNFTILGNTTVASGAFFSIPSGGSQVHTITTNGNFTNNGTVDFRNGNVVNLIFTGSANKSFSGSTATLTRLNNLTVNKGVDQAPVLTVDVLGTSMSTLTTGWLTLTSGTINFNNSASYSLNTASSAYSIPATSRLKVSAGTVDIIGNVNNDAGDLLLAGTLEVAGGNVNVNPVGNNRDINNDIEYASAGTPTIIVSSGSLYVNGAIRRPTSTLSGALVYNQNGGTVTVGGRNCDANSTRGVFEIEDNTGSSFTLSGGTLNVRRSTSGAAFADLYINPATLSAAPTNGTIQLGMDANTAVTTPLSMNIVPTVFNFSVLNAGTAQIVNMKSSGLTSAGTVTINTNSTLQTNALNVNIGGNLTITGTYNGTIAGGNTTTFNGTGPQTGDLTPGSTFQDITINKPSGSATLNGSTSINNLNILSGDLSVSGTLNINGNIINNSTQSGAGILNFLGVAATTSHSITSSGGVFQNLSLGGTSTTKKITVYGNMTVNGTLDFTTSGTSRYLYIQSNKLTFGINAIISNAGATRFIRTNGVSSDLGVVKNWNAGAGAFVYAIGTRTNYTPATFNLTIANAGTLTVAPVDDQHPTANAVGQQILNYYWIVTRGTGITYSNTGTHAYQFPTGFIGGSGGTLIAAHLDALKLVGWTPSPGNGGSFSTAGANTIMTFSNSLDTNFPGTGILSTDPEKEFHYTAGTNTTLPSPITPVYSRLENASTVGNLSVGGDWTLASNWTTSSTGFGGTIQSVVPAGRPVEIIPGSRINMDAPGLRAFSTKINGLIVVPSTTSGHNLGTISGTGTLRTSNSTLPAGNYTTFVSAAGGTIEYVAPMNMNNLRTTYNHLLISGSGALNMSIDIALNGNLTIASGTTLNNGTANQDISIAGNWVNNGTFSPGTGAVIFNGAIASQSVSGTTSFTNVTVAKTGNVTLSGTTTVTDLLTLTTGNVMASATYPLRFGASATYTGGSASSFINGPAVRVIAASGTFTYPLGSTLNNQYRPATIFNTNGSDTWTVQYVGKDPSIDGYSHKDFNTTNLGRSSGFEYWNVTPASSTSASLTLTYNTGSYVPPNIGTVANLRISHWDGAKWDLPTGGGSASQSGTNISGSVTYTDINSFSPFTLGSLDFDSPLPVTWLSFTANRVDHSIVLNWKTAQEHNNDHFEIERSVDGKTFSKMGTRAAAGNSKVAKSYEFIDNEVSSSSAYYYRIKQVDADGKSSYSSILMVTGSGVSKQRWIAMPNPVSEQSKFHVELIDLSVDAEHQVKIQVISAKGVMMYEGKGTLNDLNPILENVMQNMGTGIYIVQIADDNMREYFKIVRN